MYLDELLETLTALKDCGKLMPSARVFADGKEVTGIETNGFDAKLLTDEYNFIGDDVFKAEGRAKSAADHSANQKRIKIEGNFGGGQTDEEKDS